MRNTITRGLRNKIRREQSEYCNATTHVEELVERTARLALYVQDVNAGRDIAYAPPTERITDEDPNP